MLRSKTFLISTRLTHPKHADQFYPDTCGANVKITLMKTDGGGETEFANIIRNSICFSTEDAPQIIIYYHGDVWFACLCG